MMPVNTPVRAYQYSPTTRYKDKLHSIKDGSPPPIPLREVKNPEQPPTTPPDRSQVYSIKPRSLQPILPTEMSRNGDTINPHPNKEPFYLKLLESAKDYRKGNDPLPELPDNISIYDIPYDWPEQVWPEIKRRCTLNPLHLRKRTICFLISAVIVTTTVALTGSIYYGKW